MSPGEPSGVSRRVTSPDGSRRSARQVMFWGPKLASFQVTFVTPEGRQVEACAEDDEYLFDVAAGVGLDLPHMCLQGWCTSCAARLLDGKVDQAEARRIYPQDEAAGFVLLCSAFARSDLRLLTHQKEAMRVHRQEQGLPAPRG